MIRELLKKGMGLRTVALVALVAILAGAAFLATPSTEATIQTEADGMESVTAFDASNGQTLYILNSNNEDFVRFEIEATGGASASFTHNDAADDGQRHPLPLRPRHRRHQGRL